MDEICYKCHSTIYEIQKLIYGSDKKQAEAARSTTRWASVYPNQCRVSLIVSDFDFFSLSFPIIHASL